MASTEQAFPSTALEIGGGRVITTPFQFVADADTFLRVVSVCSVSGIVLAVQGRRLDEAGVIQPIVETHAPASNRTTKSDTFRLGVGPLLNLTVFARTGAPLAGQCYVLVQLMRNAGGAAVVLGTLLGGYVAGAQALGFPGSPVMASTDGSGAVRSIVGTFPGPGINIAESVPTGARWELLSVASQFATNAVVITRSPLLAVGDGVQTVGLVGHATGQAASLVVNWTWGGNLPSLDDSSGFQRQGPIWVPIYLLAGWGFSTFVYNLQAGDQWGPPIYTVREWLEVNS